MIYFVRAAGTDYVKIGTTSKGTAAKRVSEMQTGSPHALVIEATADGGEGVERRLHIAAALHAVRGEWFCLTPAQVQDLCALVPGFIAQRDNVRAKLASGERVTTAETRVDYPAHADMGPRGLRVLGARMLAAVTSLRSLGVRECAAFAEVEDLGSRLEAAR